MRRDGQRQQPPQIDFEYARKYEGQHHEQYQLSRHRQQVRQAADVVGQAHHLEVVVRDMRYLVSKHPGYSRGESVRNRPSVSAMAARLDEPTAKALTTRLGTGRSVGTDSNSARRASSCNRR